MADIQVKLTLSSQQWGMLCYCLGLAWRSAPSAEVRNAVKEFFDVLLASDGTDFDG